MINAGANLQEAVQRANQLSVQLSTTVSELDTLRLSAATLQTTFNHTQQACSALTVERDSLLTSLDEQELANTSIQLNYIQLNATKNN